MKTALKVKRISDLFSNISPSYDFANRVLSWSIDSKWRNHAANSVKNERGIFLDIGTGTAEQLIAICKKCRGVNHCIGLDISMEMLFLGNKKILANKLENKTLLVAGNCLNIPLKNNSVNFAAMTFGIRNMDIGPALEEACRILKPGGKIVILEFSMPENRFVRFFYLVYLRKIIPFFGAWIFGNKEAYTYLGRSIESFPHWRTFCRMLAESGFENINATRLTFGAVSVYEANKR